MNDRTTSNSAPFLVFATKGAGSNEEQRIVELLGDLPHDVAPFDRRRKLRSFWRLLREIAARRHALVVMEGTGLAGGGACLIGRLLFGVPYVVSSGDAVGPWIGAHRWWAGPPAALYERLLCRFSAGFIGWTPYLVGRALTFGAPGGVTAPGWVIGGDAEGPSRDEVRRAWGVPPNALVFGLVGSLVWNRRRRYCYGLELVTAVRRVSRPDVAVVVVGDGDGLARLRDAAGDDLNRRVFLPGPCALHEVMNVLRAFDVASLPQSTDAVGAFRYTTKLAEYTEAGLPVVTTQIPASYDLDQGQFIRLQGAAPWSEQFIDALASFISVTRREDLSECRYPASRSDVARDVFDKASQAKRVREYVAGIVETRSDRTRVPERFARPGEARTTKRLLSVGHSYVVAVNRAFPRELQAQSDGRWEVTVAAPDHFRGRNDIRPLKLEPAAPQGVPLESIPATLTRQVHVFTYGSRLRKLIRNGGFDLVHAWEEPYIVAGWQIAKAAEGVAPVVFRSAQSLPKRYPPPFAAMERYCVGRMAGWLFSGQLVEQNLLKRPGYADRPRHCTPLGYDPALFRRDREAGDAARQSLGGDDSPVVGYLGRLVPEKGIRVLMSSLERVRLPWRLMLVGDGPLAKEVRSWGERFPGRVWVCDNVQHDEVPAYLNAMDLLVAPSLTTRQWREQFGRMVVEAFACGVPVIGSDSGEVPYVIGEAGVVTPEGDAVALAAAIERLIDDPAERSRLSQAGLARAAELYTWPTIARNTLGFFDGIVEGNAAPAQPHERNA